MPQGVVARIAAGRGIVDVPRDPALDQIMVPPPDHRVEDVTRPEGQASQSFELGHLQSRQDGGRAARDVHRRGQGLGKGLPRAVIFGVEVIGEPELPADQGLVIDRVGLAHLAFCLVDDPRHQRDLQGIEGLGPFIQLFRSGLSRPIQEVSQSYV